MNKLESPQIISQFPICGVVDFSFRNLMKTKIFKIRLRQRQRRVEREREREKDNVLN